MSKDLDQYASTNDADQLPTAADTLIMGLKEMGVTHIFSNLGSDHPDLIESLAQQYERGEPGPKAIIAPYESVGLSAAQGYTQVSGIAQAMFVHCDVGTQTLGGAIHNIARAKVPVFIFSGETGCTIRGELFGSRNRPVQTLQDSHDQHGLVRSYVKWSTPMRTGQNAKQLVYRGMQIANSLPKGPVYLTAPREYLSERVRVPVTNESARWPVVAAPSLDNDTVQRVADALAQARNPLVITSNLGRDPLAVPELVRLCERLAIPVVEAAKGYVNFPSDHPLHLGYRAEELVTKADVVLIFDCDTPWDMATVSVPDETVIFHIDTDPLKRDLCLWHVPVNESLCAGSLAALKQINQYLDGCSISASQTAERRERLEQQHSSGRALWAQDEVISEAGFITVPYLLSVLREFVDDETLIADESITNQKNVLRHLPRNKPGTYFTSGGASLGWNGGAAVGMKMAAPEKTVVSICGDGCYFFSVPSSVHWMSRRYDAPFVTIILNNGGWNATKENALSLYPGGTAQSTDRFWVNLQQEADLPGVAKAAGNAFGVTVKDPAELHAALEAAFKAVNSGQSAVVDVHLERVSYQND